MDRLKIAQEVIANVYIPCENKYIKEVVEAIKGGYRLVNMNFNTNSATSCYTAVNEAIKGVKDEV